MWRSVFLLSVASAVVLAEADADPEPKASPDPFVYLSRTWAAEHFGSEADTRFGGTKASSPSFGFLPVLPPPRASFLSVGNVRAAPPSVVAIRNKPQAASVPVAPALPPTVFFLTPSPPLFFHTIHLRVPDTRPEEDARPVPVTAPAHASFATQHTAQQPIRQQHFFPTFILPPTVAAPLPAFASQHTAQSPMSAPSVGSEEEEEEASPALPPRNVLLAHFPTQLASFTSFRDAGDGPVAPAGIAQSLQPTFFTTSFRNDAAHPTLHNKEPSTDGTVIEA